MIIIIILKNSTIKIEDINIINKDLIKYRNTYYHNSISYPFKIVQNKYSIVFNGIFDYFYNDKMTVLFDYKLAQV